MRRTLLLLLATLILLGATHAAEAQSATLRVNSADDPGDGSCDASCTLRDAILNANARAGPDRIEFAIGQGQAVIRPASQLPALADGGTVIDATSQPGFTEAPLIMIDGSAAPEASGLLISAAEIEVRGLAVGNFARYGLGVIGEEADNVRLLNNWVGLALDGRTAAPNRLSGVAVLLGADEARIGDICSGCGNRIAGNGNADRTGHGVLIAGNGTTAARVLGNVIGLDRAGNPLPNDDGILIVDQAQATVGGRGAGAGNVLSGNTVAGLEIRDTRLFAIRVEGNRIGVDEGGTRAAPNDVGIFLNQAAANVAVGSAATGAGNVISGNRVGIAVESGANAITIQGNLIGLDGGGRSGVGNSEDGISIIDGARAVTVGGSGAGEGNWIAGNGNAIVIADGVTRSVRITGNVLGLSQDGRTAIPNQGGIQVTGVANVSIGGRANGAENTIVATVNSAIEVVAASGTEIIGNRLGLRPDDTVDGNGIGITLRDGATDTEIESNRIVGSRGAGIAISGETSQRNRISRNAFIANAGIAIDLAGDGPTPNDPDDTDSGPNAFLNAPVIERVTHDGIIQRMSGTAWPRAQVEIYRITPAASPQGPAHPSGFGPGGQIIVSVPADAGGHWEAAAALPPGTPVTALAIDPLNNTSEFARNFFPAPPILLNAGFTPAGWFAPDAAAAAAFAPLGGRLIAAFRFSAAAQQWEVYRPALPILSSLTTLHSGDALWILLDEGARLAWPQPDEVVGERVVPLEPGLNLVTWTGPSVAAGDALAAVAASATTLFRWNSGISRFETLFPALPIPGAPTLLNRHDTVWIRLNAPADWPQPAP